MVEADTDRILEALAARPGFPTEAVRMAAANRVAVVPAMLERFEAFTTGSDRSELNADILFLSFHLLGEWREKSAFRPLARFLRCPDDAVEFALGDGNCETCHRVMAMLFDGDPQPLYDIILDPAADEFVRSRMCETVAMVAIRGELPREEATRFLRACYSELERQDPCYVWDGWQGAVAMLGLQDLVPQVKVVFERELVDPAWLSYDDFEDDLKRAIDNPDFPYARPKEYEDWTDTAAGLSHWSSFSEQQVSERTTDDILAARLRHTMQAFTPGLEPPMPLVNPYRNIGRNDPCPCGSGKKFKKCCLGKELA